MKEETGKRNVYYFHYIFIILNFTSSLSKLCVDLIARDDLLQKIKQLSNGNGDDLNCFNILNVTSHYLTNELIFLNNDGGLIIRYHITLISQ